MVKETQVSTDLQARWGDVVGALHKDLSFSHVKGTCLYICVHNPLWRHEIRYHEGTILENIEKVFSRKGVIRSIRISSEKQKAEMAKKSGYESPLSGLPLEEKIARSNEKKRKDGQVLCTHCQEMYTKSGICDSCRLEF